MQIKNKLLENKSLIESFFSLSALNGLNALLPLITLPYILRVVGSANYGLYAYVFVLIQYVLLLNSYGFNYSATKQIAENREDTHRLNVIYNSVIVCRLILFVAGIALFAVLSPWLLDSSVKRWMFILGLGVVLGDTLNPVWLFQGMEKMRYMTIVNIVSKSVFTILIFVFIRTADDYPKILLINSLGYILAGIASIIIAKKQFNISFFIPKKRDIEYQFREGAALFGTTVGINLYGNANVFILNFFVGESALGLYAAAEKIIKGLQSLTLPVVQALFPYTSKDFLGKSVGYKINRIKKISGSVFLIFTVPNVMIFFSAGWLVTLLAGADFVESVWLLKIMCPIFTIGAVNHVMGIAGLINLGRQKLFFYAVMAAGAFSVLFLLSTVSYWGIYAAGIAMLLSEVLLLIICTVSLTQIKAKWNI